MFFLLSITVGSTICNITGGITLASCYLSLRDAFNNFWGAFSQNILIGRECFLLPTHSKSEDKVSI